MSKEERRGLDVEGGDFLWKLQVGVNSQLGRSDSFVGGVGEKQEKAEVKAKGVWMDARPPVGEGRPRRWFVIQAGGWHIGRLSL